MACVANLLPKTLLTTSGAFHLSGDMWAVREEAHSFSVTPVSCVASAWKTQAYHARARELQCIATENVREPGSSPDLLMVQSCTAQYGLAVSDDKLRVLFADQPPNIALIF